MALGLPEHLARDALKRAVQRAAHAAAAVCLLAATVVGVSAALGRGRIEGWIGVAAMLSMLTALVIVALRPTVPSTLLYLIVGSGAVFLVTVLVMSGDTPFRTSNNVVVAMPRVALVLIGGAGAATTLLIAWAALGYVVGELAALLASAHTGTAWAPNTAAAFALAVVVCILVVDRAGRRARGDRATPAGTPARDPRGETELLRASRQMRELALQHDRELRATARLHDTALTHLLGIASAGSGPVDERQRAAIRHDLALIVGRDWAAAPSGAADPACPRLDQAMTAAEHAGLRVQIIGDAGALALVTPERAEALDAAVAQALVNVRRHAGVETAEVAIGVTDDELTIAVMDTGVGFDERDVPTDRIGLRTSIRGRVERAGGTVQLWSTKGVGTTLVLSMPTERVS